MPTFILTITALSLVLIGAIMVRRTGQNWKPGRSLICPVGHRGFSTLYTAPRGSTDLCTTGAMPHPLTRRRARDRPVGFLT